MRIHALRCALAGLSGILITLGVVVAGPPAAGAGGGSAGDTPVLLPGARPLPVNEEDEAELLQRDLEFISGRTAGDRPLTAQRAGALRGAAASAAAHLKPGPQPGPITFPGAWSQQGPNPIVQVTRSTPIFTAMSGRIGALAIRPSNGEIVLGAAQGGIWTYDAATGTWTPRSDGSGSLAIGALAVAPSNDAVMYAGTGEGALSGDSYFGNGILRSTDGGHTWTHVSGDYFFGVATAGLAVDPRDADHLYAAILRGRGGNRRTTPTAHSQYGVWESRNGGATWTLVKPSTGEANGATGIEIDPREPDTLYSTFWGDGVYKTTNGGQSWSKIMNGLPTDMDPAADPTRFSLGLSHPAGITDAVLYLGFGYADTQGDGHHARVWKSTDAGAHWTLLPAGTGVDSVDDYCAEQCSYDNVIEVDPTNPDVVFAAGQFGYSIGSGGIFRSDDGGQTWKNLGWDMHPDFHALAMDPADPAHVVVGNDGGVWYSDDRGGRPSGSDPLDAVTWQNLNGTVDPDTAAVTHRSGLAISQFTSIANVPTVPARLWGGTQDNGTVRKSTASASWFDVASGDGGQVLVDPTDANFVYGTYFGITPYRMTDGGAFFFSNAFIRTGINLGDRAEFYVPWVMNRRNPNQLFLGTYRLYRTDNAKAPNPGDVRWKPISGDLTSGCAGPAPNGGRGCYITAVGVGGGDAVYAGTEEGFVQLSTDAQVNGSPSWTRVGASRLPNRPVSQIAVDRSNYRIAYVAYNGFNAATPSRPGHVFRTTNAGQTWTDVSGNLPDAPVNSVVLDPSFANILYAGTDVGTFVTYDGGTSWSALGTGMPTVATWQLDLDPSHRTLAAGTHGRGAFRMTDTVAAPALVLTTVAADTPVGAGSAVDYTLTVANVGNAGATGVAVTDPIPADTTFVSADSGGTLSSGRARWTGKSIPAGGSLTLHLRVRIDTRVRSTAITNDGVTVTSQQGPSTTGSPVTTRFAPRYAVGVAPASQFDGNQPGTSVTYHVAVRNNGFSTDSYNLSTAGGTYPVTLLDAACSTQITGTPSITAGQSADVCVRVDIPGGASGSSSSTITARSVGSPTVSAAATVTTAAVNNLTLLVDDDNNSPDVQAAYATALGSAGVAFDTWDVSVNGIDLPQTYLNAHRNVVWFTGNAYPAPIAAFESRLQSFLDAGGRLLMSGQDILDQAAGTTSFVHDYLHIDWDGTEAQNDKATAAVHGVPGDAVTDGIGAVPLHHEVLGATFEDRITPNGGAAAMFTDDTGAPDALDYAGNYKVVFLAFPMEAYGGDPDRAGLVTRVFGFFGP